MTQVSSYTTSRSYQARMYHNLYNWMLGGIGIVILNLTETQEEKQLDRDIKHMTYRLVQEQNSPVAIARKMKKQWHFQTRHAQLSA